MGVCSISLQGKALLGYQEFNRLTHSPFSGRFVTVSLSRHSSASIWIAFIYFYILASQLGLFSLKMVLCVYSVHEFLYTHAHMHVNSHYSQQLCPKKSL